MCVRRPARGAPCRRENGHVFGEVSFSPSSRMIPVTDRRPPGIPTYSRDATLEPKALQMVRFEAHIAHGQGQVRNEAAVWPGAVLRIDRTPCPCEDLRIRQKRISSPGPALGNRPRGLSRLSAERRIRPGRRDPRASRRRNDILHGILPLRSTSSRQADRAFTTEAPTPCSPPAAR